MSGFDWTGVVPRPLFEAITDARAVDPERAVLAARNRKRRRFTVVRGRVCLAAVDPLPATDRGELLARLVRALASTWLDGVVAPVEVLEDLLYLDHAVTDTGTPGCLHGKLIATVGGSPDEILEYKIDAVRLHNTQELGHWNRLGLPLLASAPEPPLGLPAASRMVWLVAPADRDWSELARSTALPVLLATQGNDLTHSLRTIETGMATHPNIRGALLGPETWMADGLDPLVLGGIAGRLIHQGASLKDALKEAAADRKPVCVG